MTYSRRKLLNFLMVSVVAPASVKADGHATTHQVSIEGFAFVPASLEISAGDTVTFINQDIAPHTATSGAFDTGRLGRGESASLTFPSAGQFDYRCSFHPNMTAQITVN